MRRVPVGGDVFPRGGTEVGKGLGEGEVLDPFPVLTVHTPFKTGGLPSAVRDAGGHETPGPKSESDLRATAPVTPKREREFRVPVHRTPSGSIREIDFQWDDPPDFSFCNCRSHTDALRWGV